MRIYLCFIAVMSFVALCAYFSDKVKAKRGAWRVPEKVLLGLGIFGGAIGAIIGMKLFRHKTKHTYFWVVNIIGLILQIALAVLLIIF